MAVVALKLLEEGNRDNPEYSCAFLQSPVNDLSQYRKAPIFYNLLVTNLIIFFLDALFSERINELKHGITSVSKIIKIVIGVCISFFFKSHQLNIRNKSLAIVHGTADGKTCNIQ